MKDITDILGTNRPEQLSILMICASNVCRSPYAEYWLRRLAAESPVLRDRLVVRSAAVVNRSREIFPKTRDVLLEEGWSREEIDAHIPVYKRDCRDRFRQADIIIGMTRAQKIFCPARRKFITLSEAATGTYTFIEDPFLKKGLDEYKLIIHQIRDFMPPLVQRLEELYR